MIGEEELIRRFSYHHPREDQARRYELLRRAAFDYALLLDENVPDSPEKTRAFAHLDEVVMNANAAVARREPRIPGGG